LKCGDQEVIAMRWSTLTLALFFLNSPVRADDIQPNTPDFIPIKARIYFDYWKSPMFWGAESSKWYLA
jgi:hypothetical protein